MRSLKSEIDRWVKDNNFKGEGVDESKKKYKLKMKADKGYNRGDRTAQSRRYAEKHPEKAMCHSRVYCGIKSGKLTKPSHCECGSDERICAHHDDYSKPLDIKWVCWECHNKLHGR